MDFQRAVQAYIWATPVLNSKGWRAGLARFGVDERKRNFLVLEDSALPQHVIMTVNQVTPYAWALMDLKEDGPMVAVVPPRDVLGGFCDFWQRALGDVGAPGPDGGEGGKYLILPPRLRRRRSRRLLRRSVDVEPDLVFRARQRRRVQG